MVENAPKVKTALLGGMVSGARTRAGKARGASDAAGVVSRRRGASGERTWGDLAHDAVGCALGACHQLAGLMVADEVLGLRIPA